MASTGTSLARHSRSPRRATLHPNVAALILILVMVPIIGLVSSSAEFLTIGLSAATIVLLLVVLWSAEAAFYVLIFSMLLSPEFIVGSFAEDTGNTTRGITLRLDDYIIAIIGLAWLVRLAVYKEAAVLRRTPLNAPIFAYIAFSFFVTLFGALTGRLNLTTGFFYVMKYLEYTVIYFLVVNYVRDRGQVRRLLVAALVTAVIIAAVATAQIPARGRVTAPFEGEQSEPNTLGGYLVLLMAMALAFAGETKTPRVRWLSLAATGVMVLPLAYTYSRTSWLAFAAMLLATIAMSRNKAMYLVMVAAFLIIMVAFPPEALIERATYTLSSQRDSVNFMGFTIEPSAGARLQAWTTAAQALAEYPLLGAGVTGYGLIDTQYPRVIAETGFIGLALFLWLLWCVAGTGVDLLRQAGTEIEIVLAKGFLAGFVGLLVHGIGANTFIIVRIMEPMWLLAGLVGATLLMLEQEQAAESLPVPSEKDPSGSPLRGGLSAA